MDKQKQIEEMAKVIFAYVDSKDRDKVYILHSKVAEDMKTYSHNYGVAEKLYNANCRIVDKGWVVLSKREYEKLCKGIKEVNYTAMFNARNLARIQELEEQLKIAREQAIKEFAEKLKSRIHTIDYPYVQGSELNVIDEDSFYELAKEMGVEAEE